MSDSRAARFSLLVLVLLGLFFVQITGAVSMRWLLPLYALSLASPILARYAKTSAYLGLWNGAVVAIFGILLLDAQQSGIRYMLEDGLILAALCQVHLLNNLSKIQKPDLIFFNSFLIAIATSFFSQDALYAVVFLAYVPSLFVTMQLLSKPGTHTAPSRLVGPCLRQSVWALAISAVFFGFLPRDFDREGFVAPFLLKGQANTSQIGFSEEVELGPSAPAHTRHRVVLRLRRPVGSQVPSHWRGASFSAFVGREWKVERLPQSRFLQRPEERWRQDPERRGVWMRGRAAPGMRIGVEIVEPQSRRLFAPLHTIETRMLGDHASVPLRPLADGTLRIRPFLRQTKGAVTYELALAKGEGGLGSSRKASDPDLRKYTQIHARSLPQELFALAHKLAGDLPKSATRAEVAESFRSFLSTTFGYELPGAKGAAKSLGAFIRGEAPGHCEYFASALALMLRVVGIPARLCTGYLVADEEPEKELVTVRGSSAHAWVEVWISGQGWRVFDPTPASENTGALASAPFYESLLSKLESLWVGIAGFDAKERSRLFKELAAIPGRAWDLLLRYPVTSLGLIGVLFLLYRVRRRSRRTRRPPAILCYENVLGRLGLERPSSLTPREFLETVDPESLSDEALLELRRVTSEHEQARYACS